MEFANSEVVAAEQTWTKDVSKDLLELDSLQLALVGGGIAEVILG
jgi:hypothetical protein